MTAESNGSSSSHYGDMFADVYDEWYLPTMDPGSAVEFLYERAQGGRVLELGVGTGRVAIPLALRGLHVEGIEGSPKMVGQLRAKPDGERVKVTVGNFEDVAVDGEFELISIPFGTFFLLTTQESQLRCLRNIAAHLKLSGRLILDAFVPNPGKFASGQAISVEHIDEHGVRVEFAKHDPVSQCITSSRVVMGSEGVRTYSSRLRYAWPAELDAMAIAAGLSLAERYGNYDAGPFSKSSTRHVSVYEKKPY